MDFLKKVFGNIQTLLIVVLVIVIIMMKSCGEQTIDPQIITKTKIEYISIEKKVPQYVPKWKTRIETEINIDTFLTKVDTSAILNDYYSKYYYEDTLSLDTLGYVLVKDTISKNKIASRNIDYKLLIPKITIEKTIILNKREFYTGFGVTGNIDQLNYIGVEGLYRTKKKQAFGLGIGVNQYFIPVISGRMYWRIGK
jgi:hypothetical protein